jgi:hypothetical protein
MRLVAQRQEQEKQAQDQEKAKLAQVRKAEEERARLEAERRAAEERAGKAERIAKAAQDEKAEKAEKAAKEKNREEEQRLARLEERERRLDEREAEIAREERRRQAREEREQRARDEESREESRRAAREEPEREEKEEAAAAPASDLSGWWEMINRIDETNYPQYKGLRLGYRIQLEQDGNRITGRGQKWTEDGRSVSAAARSPITVSGTIDGRKVTLNFTEHGAKRSTSGGFTWTLSADRTALRGSFWSTAADTRGRSTAVRLP